MEGRKEKIQDILCTERTLKNQDHWQEIGSFSNERKKASFSIETSVSTQYTRLLHIE